MKYFIVILFLLTLQCDNNKRQNLYIFNWTDYICPRLIKKFENEHNCRIVYDMYNSNENMLTRALSSNFEYDIIVPTGYFLEVLINKNLIAPIDPELIPNLNNLSKSLLKKSQDFDPGNRHGIPYFWGTNGLIYNKKYLSSSIMDTASWGIINHPSLQGKGLISMLEDAREVVGAALIHAGYSPNTVTTEALKKAATILISWDQNISHYDSDSYKNEIQDETIVLAQAYNGDALQIMSENPEIGFTLPKEGVSLGIDFLAIPINSPNKTLAHRFINFLLDPENGKMNALYVQYATPNEKSKELLPDSIKHNPYIYPDSQYLKKCHFIKDIKK